MKPFESFLAPRLEEFIAYRKGLGYKEKPLRQTLGYIDRYLVHKKMEQLELHPSFFLKFRESLKLNPRTVNDIMSSVNSLSQYFLRMEYFNKNPLSDIPSLKEFRFIPFVFSPKQIDLLLQAVQKRIRKNKKYFLYDLAEYTAILLLVRCGLRISEPTRFLLSHFSPNEVTLYIEKTKFTKDRLIPIPKSTSSEIQKYLSLRRTLLGMDQNPNLFICGQDKKLTRTQLYPTFNRAVKDIGLDQPKKTLADTTFGRPTPHSLRHSFAVNTLLNIKKRGISPQYALPILAAYMGHCSYRDTAVYLKVIDAKQRLDLLSFSRGFTKGG